MKEAQGHFMKKMLSKMQLKAFLLVPLLRQEKWNIGKMRKD